MDRTYPSRDEHAGRRRELQGMLSAMVDSAADRNGIELYLSTQAVLGFPVPCSLLVTVEPEDPGQPVRLPGDMVADGLRDKYGDGAQVTTLTLPSGPAVRCRRQETTEDTRDLGQPADRPNTVLDLYLPVPDFAAWMVLTFSTPMPELADAQVELFDAIAATLRWS
ncbi:hypothetical protein E1265_02355 [Streptomyces sp. 8K308]|uniref:hypothetical protein n=1 Tax=Streptomyces sp. 8K308 TaxID=2530388 RepID=UPI0010514E5F|nr:hypothetical protein [Streptomyces sp. 8K308]TDC27141.1 hypothetical protein E1265_02355 [Streptomyces sp. 8K308]